MYEVSLIILGILLGLIPPWYLRRRRLKTHWAALRAELQLCEESIGHLLDDQVASPLYRLPLQAYEVSFPVLMADGAVAEAEVLALGKCFGLIKDINRGLDNAAEAYMSGQEAKLKSEYSRNLMKARDLVGESSDRETLLEKSRVIINGKLAKKWWQYSR